MAKQINVNLAFTADTSQAKAQIQDLQTSLNSISSGNFAKGTSTLSADIQKASAAALDLQVHLKNAINQDTGRLDFARFNESIKKSGTSLNAYADSLRNLGPQGEQAFMKLARAVSNSEIPLRRSNTLMNNLWIAMKNTARWQLSSTALHSFIGTIQSAYGYAKNLNQSLNNIRIVTGYDIDQMAKFAKEANKAAQALSTTTTEYTNASLIYYQQGLKDDEVKERTDVTIKMANVSRESAQVVSDQMTAVWNNFADGSKSLEYYADVMTALGAATASSTAEISAGLEKFAAIAETVGLSYEYSTAALATITATTRQSADVVGNALKTLFARIQGLSLGETLEDGVDLNKYSKALDTVGVKVLDANGQMREMDDILDDLAAKWDTIGKAEQTALAQTVAGVRQYTQLVALMENWDFMEQNLNVAYNSTGTLQEQADIYAESWEAAGKRVKASAEDIFDSLLSDKFFIGMLDGIESVLDLIGKLIDSLGGAGGAVAALGVIFTKVFSAQMQTGLENLAYTLKMSTESGRQSVINERLDFFKMQRQTLMGDKTYQGQIRAQEAQYQQRFIEQQLNKNMSSHQTEKFQLAMQNYMNLNDKRIALASEKDSLQLKSVNAKLALTEKMNTNQGIKENKSMITDSIDKQIKEYVVAQRRFEKSKNKNDTNLIKRTQALKDAATQLAKDGKIQDEKALKDYIKSEIAFQEKRYQLKDLAKQSGLQEKQLDEILAKAQSATISWSATTVDAARSAGQLVMGINSLKAAFTAIKDPDTSGWEKFSSVMLSLSFGLPAIIQGFRGLKAVASLLHAETIALGLNSAAQFVNAKARMFNSKRLYTGSKEQVLIKGGTAKNIAANALLGMGDILLNLAPYLATLAVVAVAISKITAQWNAHETAVKKASEKVAEAKKAYQQTENALESFKNNRKDFENATSAMDGLKTSTQEYADALEEANEKAKNLIETYDLYGQFTIQNGAIIFNEGVLDSVEQEKAKTAAASKAFMYDAQLEESEAIRHRDSVDFYRKNNDKFWGLTIQDGINGAYTAAWEKMDKIYYDQAAKLAYDFKQQTEFAGTFEEYLNENWIDGLNKAFLEPIVKNQNILEEHGETLYKDTKQVQYHEEEVKKAYLDWKKGAEYDKLATINGEIDYARREQLLTADAKLYEGKINVKDSQDQLSGINFYDWILGLASGVDWDEYYKKYALEINAATEDQLKGAYRDGTTLKDASGKTLLDDVDYNKVYSFITALENPFGRIATASESVANGLEGLAEVLFNLGLGANYDASTHAEIENQKQETANAREAQENETSFNDLYGDDIKQIQSQTGVDLYGAMLNAFIAQKNGDTSNIDVSSLYSQMSKSDWETISGLDYSNSETGIQELLGLIKASFDQEGDGEYSKSEYDRYWNESDKNYDSEFEEYELDSEKIKAQRDALRETNDLWKENPSLLNEALIAENRQEKGLEKLTEVFDDYGTSIDKAMKKIKKFGKENASKEIVESAQGITGLRDGLSDLFNVSKDFTDNLDLDVIADNYEDIKKAINGDEAAFGKVQTNLLKEYFKSLNDGAELSDTTLARLERIGEYKLKFGENIDIDHEAFLDINQVATQAVTDVLTAGGSLEEAVTAYNDAISLMGATAGDIESITFQSETGEVTLPPNQIASVKTEKTPEGQEVSTVTYTSEEGETKTFQFDVAVPKGKITGGNNNNKSPKKGGGGGGGGSKPKRIKKSDTVKRYKEVDDKLDDLTKAREKAAVAGERMYGKDRLDYMRQQNEELEKEIGLLEQKAAEARVYLEEDKKALQDQAAKLGVTFEFDENGNLANYTEAMNSLYDRLDANADGFQDEGTDELQEEINYLISLIDVYDGTKGVIEDLELQGTEKLAEKLDNQLEMVQLEVEMRLELSDDSLELLEYQLGKIEDDAFKAAEAIANLNKQTAEVIKKSEINAQGIVKILENKGLTDDQIAAFLSGDTSALEGISLTESEIKALREGRDGLIEANEELADLRESIGEKLSENFDAWQEKLQEGIDKVQHFGSVLESYGNIIDIVGEKTLGVTDDFLKDLSDKVVDNAIDNLSAVKDQYKATKETLASAQTELDDAIAQGDEDMIKYWTEQVRTISQEADSLSEEVLGAWEEALNKVVEVFEAAVETAVKKFNNAIYELGGLEGLSADFEKQQELADMYLEDYQKIYELSKLNRDITKSMDDMDSISGKRKLRDLQKEINDLQASGVELSEYDLEYLQKKYDLRMAEIALEETQNAKDTVRLQKDNEGNYSYVYTANTDAVDEAQQKYEDALYAMQDLSSEYIDEMSSMIIDASQQMSEELAEIRRQDFETEEEYQAALQKTEDYWMERINRQKSELDKAVNNNKTLYNEDWTNYHKTTGYKISDTDKFVTDFADSMLSALMGVETTEGLINIIGSATSTLIEDLLEASKEYTGKTEEIMNTAGTSIEDFAGDVQEAGNIISQASKEASNDVEQMGADMVEDFNNIVNEIHNFSLQYLEETQPMIEANDALVQSLNEVIETAEKLGETDIQFINGGYVKVSSDTSSSSINPPASASMDTGGYTGDWSDNKGRLAWVHKREHVLNAEDTENILKVVQLTQMMLQTIELNAQQAASGFGVLNAIRLPQEETQTLQQEVHITAEFPNVQDSNEIKDAFNTLINTASQYANRK